MNLPSLVKCLPKGLAHVSSGNESEGSLYQEYDLLTFSSHLEFIFSFYNSDFGKTKALKSNLYIFVSYNCSVISTNSNSRTYIFPKISYLTLT
jgi:hypothetical protein